MSKEELEKSRLSTFKQVTQEMIGLSADSYKYPTSTPRVNAHIDYTKEEALKIIRYGEPEELRELSLSFFYTSGFYRRMLLYYATLLTYDYLVIPDVGGKEFTSQLTNNYRNALDIIDNFNPHLTCAQIALRVVVEGAYYGILSKSQNGKKFIIINLPYSYCRSRFKTYEGIDVIEFNTMYFDSIPKMEQRQKCLKTFPQEVRIAYNSYKNRNTSPWYQVPIELGVHFNLYEDRPFLSDVIPAIIDFGEYREIEKTKDKQDLEKILVQEMPHLNDGELVFEPEEALEMHRGIVQMLGNKNEKKVDVLTSFGSVDVKDLESNRSTISNNLEKIEKSVYSEAGVSKQLFSADTNTSLTKALENDTSMMMLLGNQFGRWLSFLLNNNTNQNGISFEVVILPSSQYNRQDMFKTALSAAQNGYSFLLPAAYLGMSQKQFLDIKHLESKLLKLTDLMVPLSSSYTQSGSSSIAASREEGKAQADIEDKDGNNNKKADDEKSEKTISNENSGGTNE